MAVKNGERFIAEALDSVVSQEPAPEEIIVIDGDSSDRSAEIAARYPSVRVIRQRGTGFCGAWNEGIAEARGELIAILDSDDRWLPGKHAAQLELLAAQPELDYAVTRMRFFLDPGAAVPAGFRPELLDGDHEANMPSALLIRRRAFERVGGFEESFGVASDIDWFARAKDVPLRLGRVERVLVEKRVHDANLSMSAATEYNRELLRSLRETVARKRVSGE